VQDLPVGTVFANAKLYPSSVSCCTQPVIGVVAPLHGGTSMVQHLARIMRQLMQGMNIQGRVLCLAAIALAMLPSLAQASPKAPARTGLAADYDPDLKAKRAEIISMLRDGKVPAGQEQAAFDDFFKKFALLLLVLPENHSELPRVRIELQKLLAQAKPGPLRTKANQLTHDMMFMEIVLDRKDRQTIDDAVKCNAMLVIGDLNEEEGVAATRTPAKPWPQALPSLLKIAKSDDSVLLKFVRSPEAIRVPALIGIQRQVEGSSAASIGAKERGEITATMLKIISQKPETDKGSAAQDWLRWRAAQILAALGDPNPAIIKALADIVNDASASPRLRCKVAEALGEFKYTAGKVDAGVMSDQLGHLAVNVGRQELLRSKTPDRRRLLWLLRSVQTGLAGPDDKSGIAAAAKASPQQKTVDGILAKLKEVIKSLEDKDLEEESLALEVDTKLKDLDSVLSKPASAKVEPPATPQVGNTAAAVSAGANKK
jgi:hypothetical protein